MLDPRLLEILVCPVSKAPVVYHQGVNELWCKASGLAYPVRDGIAVMLEDQARELSDAEQKAGEPLESEQPEISQSESVEPEGANSTSSESGGDEGD